MSEMKLELLATAWSELEHIADIHMSLSGAVSAKKITDKILDTLELLRYSPQLGVLCSEPLLKYDNYRKIICGKYLCFYRVIADTIYIYHIVDGRSDYPKIFEELQNGIDLDSKLKEAEDEAESTDRSFSSDEVLSEIKNITENALH
ncbi:type II toxin-antitoxin system RelE/ParE family toxin [uncultured Ruminococcus sp.]|uniref:type II toxin-antitoxin system RelE/ParE family toxin n=1 Tax=uncultured Ruminococcus sp. TaxID=165186 RepID=UPI0025E3E864|nr:type II toxin-antitoxin system RelE/ParE family toxin [uncultured Ruminococcus sp.]